MDSYYNGGKENIEGLASSKGAAVIEHIENRYKFPTLLLRRQARKFSRLFKCWSAQLFNISVCKTVSRADGNPETTSYD